MAVPNLKERSDLLLSLSDDEFKERFLIFHTILYNTKCYIDPGYGRVFFTNNRSFFNFLNRVMKHPTRNFDLAKMKIAIQWIPVYWQARARFYNYDVSSAQMRTTLNVYEPHLVIG